ncbi:PIN domain-containing protein [Mesorhizobium sp. CAU 1741]|uniref:PIN domain-containing protein n=1 Tax=Mesorhizobium sp. CAU 1741 TaxID=3140366 RepID=UPI00325AFA7F
MTAPREFLHTNILVYAFSTDVKSSAAEALLARGCVISVQGLNEFANVARRKLLMDWREVDEALAVLRALCREIVPVDLETHALGMALASQHNFSVFDALMLASALRGDCSTFWSEDMQAGMLVDQRLRIANPFRSL